MNNYVALFRGINVGGNNILPMKDLKQIMADLGYQDINTYIQSGNVTFRSIAPMTTEAEIKLSKAIENKKGFTPKVIFKAAAAFANAINQNPFPTEDGKALHFFFLSSTPSEENLEKLTAMRSEGEAFKLIADVFYLYAPKGIGRSKLAAGAEKALGVPVTARNWNTVEKLETMLGV